MATDTLSSRLEVTEGVRTPPKLSTARDIAEYGEAQKTRLEIARLTETINQISDVLSHPQDCDIADTFYEFKGRYFANNPTRVSPL